MTLLGGVLQRRIEKSKVEILPKLIQLKLSHSLEQFSLGSHLRSRVKYFFFSLISSSSFFNPFNYKNTCKFTNLQMYYLKSKHKAKA